MERDGTPDVFFDRCHPELKRGEILVASMPDPHAKETSAQDKDYWKSIRLKTKRLGSVAYDADANIIPGVRPVFANREEVEKREMFLFRKELRHKDKDFNKTHPEMREGEIFLGNISPHAHTPFKIGPPASDSFITDPQNDWDSIGWRTKRLGEVAYSADGKPLKGQKPVFIRKREYEKACAETIAAAH